MWRPTVLLIGGMVVACTGCVMVETPDVRVGVIGSPHPRSDEPPQPTASYGAALHRVIRQQDRVTRELNKRDWDELIDEAGDWVEYVRVLNGYASSSHDPERFRRHCDRLLRATQAVRSAAQDRDANRCRRAIDACDPILDQFTRAFPLAGPPPRDAADKPAHPQVP